MKGARFYFHMLAFAGAPNILLEADLSYSNIEFWNKVLHVGCIGIVLLTYKELQYMSLFFFNLGPHTFS